MWLIMPVLLWLPCIVIAVIRKRTEYENMDNDIVQGEDDRHTDDDEGETERLPVKKTVRRDEC